MSPVQFDLVGSVCFPATRFFRTSAAMLLLCLGGLPAIGPAARAADLQAGVARIDITPDRPVTMAGYESRKDLSQGVHDPLSARAIAFERDGKRLVLVSTDVLGFYGGSAEILRKAVLEECGLQPSELFLAAIHTHSAPTVTFDTVRGHSNNVAYSQTLERKLITVVRTALAGLKPAQVGFGFGASPVGANRREVTRDENGQPKIVLGRNTEAPIDRQVQVLKVSRPEGDELAAVLFDFASHSTSLGPRNYIISGDVHGLAEQFVERYLGHGVLAPGFAGASGDIDPWYRVLPGFKTDHGWTPETVLLGTLLGEEVAHVLEGIHKTAVDSPVRTLFKTVQLPGKPSTQAGASDETPTVPLNITVGRIGEIAFVGLGAEVFNEIGRTIKAASPFPCTIVITHCNGTAGYLPTRPSYAAGGYEVQSSRFAPGAAEMIPPHVAAMLEELRGG
jgi:Neutral/alkaline non-lysosomal ceramidase, N-terminal